MGLADVFRSPAQKVLVRLADNRDTIARKYTSSQSDRATLIRALAHLQLLILETEYEENDWAKGGRVAILDQIRTDLGKRSSGAPACIVPPGKQSTPFSQGWLYASQIEKMISGWPWSHHALNSLEIKPDLLIFRNLCQMAFAFGADDASAARGTRESIEQAMAELSGYRQLGRLRRD